MRGKAAETFEELHIYQRARELTNTIYSLTRKDAFARDRGLVDQIRRAAVSIMSNIAEGFERGGANEFIQFLYIAKGSCGEVRAQLRIACDQGYIQSGEHDRLARSGSSNQRHDFQLHQSSSIFRLQGRKV